jgi:hypothetical protein
MPKACSTHAHRYGDQKVSLMPYHLIKAELRGHRRGGRR